MKYTSINHFDDFEFHDAMFTLENYQDNTLIVSVKYLNIHSNTPQNTNKYDMEITSAVITFENFEVKSVERFIDSLTNAESNFYEKDAEKILIAELKKSISLNGLSVNSVNEKTEIEIEAKSNTYFVANCSCADIKVEWDEYCGKAWYEKNCTYKNYIYDIKLITPSGEQDNVMYINLELDEDECVTQVRAYIIYNEQWYWGYGTDYYWLDAIADLQRNLPDGVILKCCVTCKHGSFCPVGNNENEIFCVNDIVPKGKSDLLFFTENNTERTKRRREYCDHCEKFAPQSDDYYTYNDFLYFLNKI